MSKYAGTKRKEPLEAFAGESQARNKYTYYASLLEKQDLCRWQISLKRLQIRKKNMQNVV